MNVDFSAERSEAAMEPPVATAATGAAAESKLDDKICWDAADAGGAASASNASAAASAASVVTTEAIALALDEVETTVLSSGMCWRMLALYLVEGGSAV